MRVLLVLMVLMVLVVLVLLVVLVMMVLVAPAVLVALVMMILGLGLLTMVMALAVLVALVMMILGLGLLTMVMPPWMVLVMALGLGLLVMIRTGSPRLLRAEPFRALVAPKMVMGQVGVLRVKEEMTTSVASTSLGHPQSVMGPLAKVCPHLLLVSRWTLTIYL